MSNQHLLFNRYEYLAEQYANKIFGVEKMGLEKEDVVMELKLRLWTGIGTYLGKFAKWKKKEGYKPMPIEYYLKALLNNKIIDIVQELSKEPAKISFDLETCDIGYYDSLSVIDWSRNCVRIGDVDFFEGLNKRDKKIFALFLKGFGIGEIRKVMRNRVNVGEVVRNQIKHLQGYRDVLMKDQRFFVVERKYEEE